MQASMIIAGLLALGLAGCASSGAEAPQTQLAETSAATAPQAVPSEPPRFNGKTGNDAYIYHQVWGDCAMLDHGIGRNYAWGRHRMPLFGVTHEVVDDGIHFTCTDGSDCIEVGTLEDTPGRINEHSVPFESVAFAQTYLAQVAELRAACKAADPAP